MKTFVNIASQLNLKEDTTVKCAKAVLGDLTTIAS
jgi:hypothetical protein